MANRYATEWMRGDVFDESGRTGRPLDVLPLTVAEEDLLEVTALLYDRQLKEKEPPTNINMEDFKNLSLKFVDGQHVHWLEENFVGWFTKFLSNRPFLYTGK